MHKLLFVGQAPPRTDPSRPFGRTKLYTWLASIGIDFDLVDKYCEFSAIINYFPGAKNGSHLAPTPEQIAECRPELQKLMRKFDPEIVVSVGKLSTQEALRMEDIRLEEIIGQSFQVDPYGLLGKNICVIPLPHPSGASAWTYQPGNQELLQKALTKLKQQFFS